MRFGILIKTKSVPIFYQHRIISFIKESLKKTDKHYKELLYSHNRPKPFTFYLNIPKCEKEKKIIQIDKNHKIEDIVFDTKGKLITLWISSIDPFFIMRLYNGARTISSFEFSIIDHMLINGEKIIWQVKGFRPLVKRKIDNNEIILKARTPILLEDEHNKPILFNNERFEYYLNSTTNRILKEIRGYGLKEKLKFKPIQMKTRVVKHTLKEFREKTGKPIMYLTGSVGVFKLKGDREDLEILYYIGLGNRRGQGFGYLEVI